MSSVKLYNNLFDKYIWNCCMKIVGGGKVKANRESLGLPIGQNDIQLEKK